MKKVSYNKLNTSDIKEKDEMLGHDMEIEISPSKQHLMHFTQNE